MWPMTVSPDCTGALFDRVDWECLRLPTQVIQEGASVFAGASFELREKLEEEEDVGEIFHLHYAFVAARAGFML